VDLLVGEAAIQGVAAASRITRLSLSSRPVSSRAFLTNSEFLDTDNEHPFSEMGNPATIHITRITLHESGAEPECDFRILPLVSRASPLKKHLVAAETTYCLSSH
jgi:hypothetical protein